jgi:hypothetical protein
VSKYLAYRFKAVFRNCDIQNLCFRLFLKREETLKLTPALKRIEMRLLNSVILLIAFLFLVLTYWPGALAVVVVWLLLQFIKKRRRLKEMQAQ